MICWKRAANPKHTHENGSFATWTLLGQCLFSNVAFSFPNLPLVTFPLPQRNSQGSGTHVHVQPSFPYPFFPLILGELHCHRGLLHGTPNLLGSLSPLHPQLEVMLLLAPPQLPAWLPPSELLIHHSSSNLTLKASPGFYLAVSTQCKMFGDTLY